MITCLKKCQYLAICVQLVSLLRIVLNSSFSDIWLFVVYALHFISPGSIRDSWQGGRPTHSASFQRKEVKDNARPSLWPVSGGEWQNGERYQKLGHHKGVSNKKGSKFTRERVKGQEGTGEAILEARVQRLGVAFSQEKKISSQTQRSPPVKLFPLTRA